MSLITPKSNLRNYYYNPDKHDLAKIKEESQEFTASGEKLVTIHHHRFEQRCFGNKHEDFKNGTQVQDVQQ